MKRRRGMLAVAAGAAAIGAAGAATGAGVALQRRALRGLLTRPDPYSSEPFGSLRGRPVAVRADDGTRLYAEIDGEDRTDLAIVFCHGWTLNQDSWHFQREAMRGLGRLVFWDQRGHGRSSDGHRHLYSLDQLGADLAAVIEQTVPEETPVVLIGHSMGGMTIMRYADRHPDRIGQKIIGAGLLCTSSGGMHELTLGLPTALARLTQRTMPHALRIAGVGAPLIERVRHLGRDGVLLIADALVFGPDAGASLVVFTEQMAAGTRMEALVEFSSAMTGTPLISDCSALDRTQTLIVGAENDTLTPVPHSLAMAEAIPSATLEVVPTAGHMAMMERPGIVTDHFIDLVARARKAIA